MDSSTSSKNDSSLVFEKESSHRFVALKDYLTRSTPRFDTSIDIANIAPKERISFHSSNDRTVITLEMSDIESSMGAEDNDDIGQTTNHDDSFQRSAALRLSMCGALHEAAKEEGVDTRADILECSESSSDWNSVVSATEETTTPTEKVEERVILHQRASNPLMVGRRLSAHGSRRYSVMSASMQEAFQQVRDTFEGPANEDATPQSNTTATDSPSGAPPCVFWDVPEVDDVAKYGYGENHLSSRRASGAHYDYGYGSDHDMDSEYLQRLHPRCYLQVTTVGSLSSFPRDIF